MVRRSARFVVPRVDHEAHFIEATKREARRAGMLEAYQKGSGLLVQMNCSQDAQERLGQAIVTYRQDVGIIGDDESRAPHFARTKAASYWYGSWWNVILQNDPPETLSDADEFYSPQQVREIVQGSNR